MQCKHKRDFASPPGQVDAARDREGERAGQARGEAAQAHAQRKALDKEARALRASQARPRLLKT